MIDETLLEAEEKMEKAVAVAKEEFATIRTGRAHPTMFSKITAEYYGTQTPVNQLASFHIPEPRMVVIQPFGAPTKLAALQLLNDEPEAFDLRLRLSEVGAFGRERPDHPLQRLDIVWQIGKIDVHEPEVYPTRALLHRSTCW